MIEKLVNILSCAELDLEAEDIADALWLASYLDQPDITARIAAPLPKETQPHFSDTSRDVSDARQQNTGKTKPPPTNDATVGSQAFLPPSQQGGKITGGMAFRSPTASALPGSLGIARALRPFKRGTPSNNQFTLDEDATAERIAELGIWVPAFKPTMTPWFEIALVIDESASMVIWQQTIAELRFLLEHHGAFRNVRTWRLIADADSGKAEIAVGTGFNRQKRQTRSFGELLDPLGRRLILVVTDCVSPSWRNGDAIRVLASWAEKTPVVITQVLPQRLWSQTALGTASSVRLRSTSFGNPNAQLSAKFATRWIENDALTQLPMPIITLEANAFSAWSRMLTGAAGVTVPGFLIERNNVPRNKKQDYSAYILQNEEFGRQFSSEERLQHFQTTASPLSRKLVQLLAAAPISLPVIRLIQHTMVPEARQIHIAEFFLSGLLEELPSQEATTDPEDVQYEFIDGVRDMLLSSASMSDSIEVLKEVSNFIGDRFGQYLDFHALLTHTQDSIQIQFNENSKPFAIIAAKVLSRFGGKYAELAKKIENTTNELNQELATSQQEPTRTETSKKSVKKPRRRSPKSNRSRIDIFIRRTCPLCINAFYPGDCDIVSVNIDPNTNTNKILVKAPEGGWKRLYARINPQPILGHLVLESAHRKCPHCGYLLPTNIEQVENINIAVVGDTFSGKSSYIAAIIHQIHQGDLQRADSYARFDCLTPDVELEYIRDVVRPLFEGWQIVQATQPSSDSNRAPLIYELVLSPAPEYPSRRINLILYDASGEDLAIEERMVEFSRYVLKADGIIFLVDPITMPEIFDLLPPFLQKMAVMTGRNPSNVLNSILRLIERYHGVGAGSRLSSLPIAINVSKSDLLKQLKTLQYQYHFLKKPTYTGIIDLNDLDIVDREVRQLLEEYGEHTLLQSTQNFSNVRFFATSATGYAPDYQGHYPNIKPNRCLDPLIWILYKMQIIRA